jgi:hypothetical protein
MTMLPPEGRAGDRADVSGRRLHCPLCGLPNGCAPAGSGSFDTPCWCTAVKFDAEALAAVPASERGRACICFRCATGGPNAK